MQLYVKFPSNKHMFSYPAVFCGIKWYPAVSWMVIQFKTKSYNRIFFLLLLLNDENKIHNANLGQISINIHIFSYPAVIWGILRYPVVSCGILR